jgi:antitoxin ParD1/3/4
MATMNISLPDEMKAWVDEQVACGRYANASDAVRDFIRRDKAATAKLQAMVDEGLSSGVSPLSLDEIIAESRRRALARIEDLAAEVAQAAKDAAA